MYDIAHINTSWIIDPKRLKVKKNIDVKLYAAHDAENSMAGRPWSNKFEWKGAGTSQRFPVKSDELHFTGVPPMHTCRMILTINCMMLNDDTAKYITISIKVPLF